MTNSTHTSLATSKLIVEKAKKMANDTTRYIDGDAVLTEYTFNEAELEAVLKQAQDDVRRELVDENTSDGYHTHTTLQGIIDTLEEDRRSFVTQPAEYKGSDANVWREGYNAALSNAQKVIRKLLDKSE